MALSAALWMGGSALPAGLATAETYRLLEGTLEDARSGASEALGGTLEISVFEPEGQDARPSLLVDAFQIEAGSQVFGPRQPIEFEGRSVLWIQIADQIQFDGDAVGLVQLRSGGELIAVEQNDLTFRFMDFRSDASGGSRLIGQLADGLLPRRISLSGTLYEVDQHFAFPSRGCPIEPRPPGGGVVIPGEGGAIEIRADGGGFVAFDSFDVEAGGAVVIQAPGDGRTTLTRVTAGSSSTIEGALVTTGSVELLKPAGVVLGATRAAVLEPLASALAAPTLAELGITAPSGAELTFDEAGVLTITTQGDLHVAAGAIDITGLTALTLVALGTITIDGALQLPRDVALTLRSGAIVVEGGLPDPGGAVIELPVIELPWAVDIPFCTAIRAVYPAEERAIGRFTFVASAARQVEIEVDARRRGEGAHPSHHGPVDVTILGSPDFDIRDVDEGSLRLGPGEAEPKRRHGRGHGRRRDVNRDGEMDLLMRFDLEDARIGRHDREVCLFGETRDGEAIEGCDAIERQSADRKHEARRADGDDD